MFEQPLLYFLKGILQDFVEDSDYLNEKVQVGVWSGFIVLENLVLKNSILSLVDVPISLSYGYIGRLEIKIPWSRLGTEPVTIVVDKVNILVEPKYEWNPGAADRREQAIKQAKLAAAEIFANQRLENQTSNKYRDFAKNWFLNAFLGKIIDNIQITVRDVHIRYEDKLSCPSDFCIGFSFESLILQSREPNGHLDEAFSPSKSVITPDSTRNYEKEINIGGADSFYKVVELNHMAVYWNPMVSKGLDVCSCSFIGRSPKEIQSLMSRTIATRLGSNRPRHHYILMPVDITAFLDMALNVGTGSMKANVRLFISEIAIHLEDRQLREIISMALNMSNFSKLERFSEFRPTCSVMQGPKLWWRYAINAVLVQLRIDRKKRFSIAMIKQRIEDKLVYIELWKSRMISPSNVVQQLKALNYERPQLDRATSPLYQNILRTARMLRRERDLKPKEDGNAGASIAAIIPEPLDEPRINLLRALEYDLSFEDLVMFRSSAEMSVSQETRNQSWLGNIFSWATGGKPAAVSDEERRKLFEALKYDPDQLFRGGKKEVDPNEVTTIVNLHLKQCSVTLGLSSTDTSSTFQSAIPFLQLKLSELTTKTVIMGDGSHVRLNLSLQDIEGFEIYPAVNRNNKKLQAEMVQHRFIFRRNLRSGQNGGDSKTVDTESNMSFSEDKSMLSTTKSSKHPPSLSLPLFSCAVELSPSNKDVEVAVKLEMEELEIWFSPTATWLDSIGIFSAWPEDLIYWSEMEMKAMNQLADFKSRVNAKLEYMMNNHSNVLIEGKVRAPVIIIHDKPSSTLDGKMNILVIDLGSVSLRTDKLAKAQRRKDLEASQFTMGGASNILQSPMPGDYTMTERPHGWDLLQNEMGRVLVKDTGSSIIDQPDDLDLLTGTLPDENLSYADDGLQRGGGRRSSLFHQYSKKVVLDDPNGGVGDFDSTEEELFDVFHCQISDLEVYLVEAIVMRDANNKGGWYAQYDLEKITIVPKFEIGVEIQVSALPWDITLPPVKLFVDIPEVNVQLSEAKLLRLAQFGADLAKGSTAFLESNTIQKLNEALVTRSSANEPSLRAHSTTRQSFGGGATSQNNSVAKSGRSGRSKRARRTRSFGGSISSQKQQSEYEFYDVQSDHGRQSVISDYKSAISMQSDHGKRLRILEDGGELVKSQISGPGPSVTYDNDDSDDDSFFSIDDNLNPNEHAKALEDLKYDIAQRENMRAKLITEIRITEADPSKSALHESIKQELNELEIHLHQLKISYVELMMQHQEYLQSFEDEKDTADHFDSDLFKEQVETFLSPAIERPGGVSHKRDLIHASVFKLSNPAEKGLQMLDIMGPNKELVYVRLSVAKVNVDLQLDVPRASSPQLPTSPDFKSPLSHRRESFPAMNTAPPMVETIPFIYRLSLSDFGLKLRHRVHVSRVSLYLRDIHFIEHNILATPNAGLAAGRMRFGDNSTNSQLPFISSDSSFGSTNRSYTSLGSNELMRLKYEVTYHRGREVDDKGVISFPQTTSHNVSLHIGYLSCNLDQDRINPLVDWGIKLQDKIAEKFVDDSKSNDVDATLAQATDGVNLSVKKKANVDPKPTRFIVPIIEASIKIDGLSFGIVRGTYPIVNATISTISTRIRADGGQGSMMCQVADVSVHNLIQGNQHPLAPSTGGKIYSRSFDTELGSRNLIFGRNAIEESPFLSMKLAFFSNDPQKFSVKVQGSANVASLVFVTDSSLLQELTREVVKGSLVQTLKRVQSNTEAKNTSKTTVPVIDTPKRSLLDEVFENLQGFHSNVNISCGNMKFFIPCNSKYCKEDKFPDLQFTINSIQSRLCLGSYCSTGHGHGLEVNASILGTGLCIGSLHIVDQFDVGCSVKVLPPMEFLAFKDTSVHTSKANVSMVFGYPLPSLNPLQLNEVQISTAISPITIHVSKDLIEHMMLWTKSLEEMFDQVSRIIDNGSKTIVDLTSKIRLVPGFAPRNDILNQIDLDFLITFGLKLYEINLQVDQNSLTTCHGSQSQNHVPFPASPLFSPSTHEEHKFDFANLSSPKRGSNGHSSMNDGMTWTLLSTIRGIEIVTKCCPKEFYDCHENFISNHFVKMNVGVQYFGIHERNQFGHINRIICSGVSTNPVLDTDIDSKDDSIRFVKIDTLIFYDLSINSYMTLAEINGIYHAPTISRIIDLVAGFLDSTPINNKARNQRVGSSQATSSTNPAKLKTDDHAAHPSSIPMSPVVMESEQQIVEVVEQPLKSTVFLSDLFRSSIIPYVRCDLVCNGMQFWFPISEIASSGTFNKSTASVCACVAFDVCLEFHQPNYTALLQQESADTRSRSKWVNSDIIMKVIGVYVADQIPPFFFSAVDEKMFLKAGTHNTSQDGLIDRSKGFPLSLTPPMNKRENVTPGEVPSNSFVSAIRPKVWLVQTEGNIGIVLTISTEENPAFDHARVANQEWTLIEQAFNIKLKLLIEANFPTVEIQGFLDYRPYLAMFESTVKPNIEKINKLLIEPMKSQQNSNTRTSMDSNKKPTTSSARIPVLQRIGDVLPITSIDEFILHFVEICEVDARMKIDNLSVILLNDLYPQPISIARIGLGDLEVNVSVPLPPRQVRYVKLERLFTNEDDVGNNRSVQFGTNEFMFVDDNDEAITPIKSGVITSSSLSDAMSISPLPSDLKNKVPFANSNNVSGDVATSSSRQVTNPIVTTANDNVNYTDALSVQVKFIFSIDYQNQKLIAVEPFLEPVIIKMNFNMFRSLMAGHLPLVFVANTDKIVDYCESEQNLVVKYLAQHFEEVEKLTSKSQTQLDQTQMIVPPPCLSMLTEKINLNVTMALLEILFLTLKSVEKLNGGYADDFSHVSSRNEISLLTIRNECGVNIKYWGHELTNTDGEQLLHPNSELPLKVSSYAESFLSGFISPSVSHVSKKINIALQSPSGLEQWPIIKNVSLEGVGCRLFSLSEDSNSQGQACEIIGGNKKRRPSTRRSTHDSGAVGSSSSHGQAGFESNIPSVVLDLVSRNGSKVLTVRSTMRVYNATMLPFTVKLVNGVDKKRKEILWESLIQPNKGTFVPAHLCNLPYGQFLITTFKRNLNKKKSAAARGGYFEHFEESPLYLSSEKSGIGEFPCPDIVGIAKGNVSSTNGINGGNADEEPEDNIDSEEADQDPSTKACNSRKWRKKLHQQRGAVNTLTYYHWMNLRDSNSGGLGNKSSLSSGIPDAGQSKADNMEANNIYSKIAQIHDHACCNISVESKGMPLKKHQVTSNSMLRTVTILPTLTIVNLLGSELAFAITPDLESFGFVSGEVSTTIDANNNTLDHLFDFDSELEHIVPQYILKPGESNQSLSMHASESIYLSLKMINNEVSSVQDSWSSFVKIPGCNTNDQQHASFTVSVELPYKNQSKLTVQLEINDQGGSRTIHCFVPYWVVSSSFIPLQFQHDVQRSNAKGSDIYLNGVDGLAPDQPFEERKVLRQESNSTSNRTKERKLPRGVGKARGINGVVLGPDLPLKGLPDVLHPIMFPNTGLVSALSASKLRQSQPSVVQQTNANNNMLLMNGEGYQPRGSSYSDSNENPPLQAVDGSMVVNGGHQLVGANGQLLYGNSLGNNRTPFFGSTGANTNMNLIQMSYTNRDRRQGRIRFRHRNTNWSSAISLDSIGERTISLDSLTRINLDENDDGNRGVNSPFFKDGKKSFDFGINVQSLDAPFQRTKVVFLVDRYNMVNLVGQSIEVKQYQQDNIFTLRSNEEVPLWWRPTNSSSSSNTHILQLRLARYGWSWSGKFSVDTSTISSFTSSSSSSGGGGGGKEENEIPIRLRNDYDNTVYFVLVCIVKQGSQISIVFKGGDQFSPYRFENQTVETFRIGQEKQSQYTNLLPYHCCAYAWDEPLANHQFTISILKNALQSQDDWEVIGTYNFERLEFLPLQNVGSKKKTTTTGGGGDGYSYSHIVIRVVAQGPTRVLQISDARLSSISSSSNGTGSYQEDLMAQSSMGKATTTQAIKALSSSRLKNPVLFHLSLHVQSFGISLVDPTPEELIYISISDIEIHHSMFKKQNQTEISMARLQIDNQLWSTPYPSLLYPLEPLQQKMSSSSSSNGSDKMDINADKKRPFIMIQLKQDFEYDGIIFLPKFSFEVQPFDINLEGTIIARLVNMGLICVETLGEVSIPTMHNQEQGKNNANNTGNKGGLSSSWSYYDWTDSLLNAPWAINCNKQKKLSLSQIQHVNDMINDMYTSSYPNVTATSMGSSVRDDLSRPLHLHAFKGMTKTSSAGSTTSAATTTMSPRAAASSRQSWEQYHGGNAIPGSVPVGTTTGGFSILLSKHVIVDYLTTVKTKRDSLLQPSPKVYFQQFDISEVRFNISFNPVMAAELSPVEVNSLFMSAISAILLAIGSTVAKIDNCPLRFQSYSTHHIFASSKAFSDSLISNYAIQAVKQAYLVLFSSEFLGNPVQLVQTLSEGIWDFIHLPMMGLLTSPEAFIVGAARGTNSLVRTLVASVCATAGHLANSLQVGLLALGVVDGYPTSAPIMPKPETEAGAESNSSATPASPGTPGLIATSSTSTAVVASSSSASLAASASAGTPAALTRKALRPNGVYEGTKMGLIGVLLDPITGFREDGARGLIVGLAKGSVGLFARPFYGILGFTAVTLEKISFNVLPRFLAHQKLRLQRTRPPRFLVSANIPLQVYSADENVGLELLARVEHGSYRHEGYLWHGPLLGSTNSSIAGSHSGANRQLMMTRNRLLLLEDHLEFTEVLWQCTFKAIKSIEIDYSESLPRKVSEEMKKNLEVALRLMMSDQDNAMLRSSSSSSSTKGVNDLNLNAVTTSFQSFLQGEPTLVIYHLPTADGSSRDLGSSNMLNSSGMSTSSSTPRSAGFRLGIQKFQFHNHEQLLRLLSHLLRLIPSLAASDVITYLQKAGVDFHSISDAWKHGHRSGGGGQQQSNQPRPVVSTSSAHVNATPTSVVVASSISAFYTPLRSRPMVNTVSIESFQSGTTETTNPSTIQENNFSNSLSPIVATPSGWDEAPERIEDSEA